MNGNPNDPNLPQGQPQQVQAPTPNGFHLLQGVGYLATGLAALFGGSGSESDDEAEVEERAPRRRFRSFGARPVQRAGAGKCCKRPAGK